MARQSNIPTLLVSLGVGAGLLYMYHTGQLHNILEAPLHDAAELKLRLTGFHADPDGSVHADIEALNPTSIPMQVQSIVGDILVGGKRAGTVQMFGDQVIRPNDQGMIPVAVRVLPTAAALYRHRGAHVEFIGKINLNNIVLPLTMNYRL
jgi:hypothetical protein